MVKTPLYWQIQGWGDLTKLNIADGDFGGELDPHGATGKGNPIGGNVTTNATGTDVHYEEWMNYISFNTFCLRICIADNATYSAASMCQHTLDIMGCEWVMPGDYTDNSFTVCDADPAYPPGVYPEANGGFSTFAQRWTGSYAESGAATFNTFTIGDTITPSAPAMTPASSNCVTYSSIGNGIPPAALSANASFVFTTGMSFSLPSITSSASGSATASGASGSATATPSDKAATGASAGKSGTKATGSSASASAAAGTTNNAASAAAPMVALVSAVAVFIGAASVLF
jgi:hypothetical protein